MKKIRLLQNLKRLWARGSTTCKAMWERGRRFTLTLSVSATTALMMAMPAYAADTGTAAGTDIWGWLDTALTDLYQKFLSVSTIAACVAASVCLILMNFSTDDRAVATSRAWLKRILLSWVILNVLGFIMNYLISLTSGGGYVPGGGASKPTP